MRIQLPRHILVLALLATMVLSSNGCGEEAEGSGLTQDIAFGTAGSAADSGPAESLTRLRRLWAGENFSFYQSSPSPDGRYLTEIDWSTGDLAVRDLETGQLHHLTRKGSWQVSADYPEGMRFSPDGRRVAYTWFNQAKDAMEIRILDFAVDASGTPRGSDALVVHTGDPLVPYWVFGWAGDDQLLIGLEQPDRTWAIGFVTLSTGFLRVLKSFDWRPPRAAPSPDGNLIAFDHPSASGSGERDIHLVSADGRLETTLVEGPGNDEVLGWFGGDGSLLFYSDRTGTPSIWRLPVSDGRPGGPAELVREDVRRLAPLGFVGDVYYFGVIVESPAFRTATIPSEGRQLVGNAMVFETPDGGRISQLAWSPDGQYVVHDASGPLGTRIYVRANDGALIGEWGLDGGTSRALRWAPDGKAVFVAVVDRLSRQAILRIDLPSGERETVLRFSLPVESDLSFSVSPDGRTLYYARVSETGTADEALIEIVAHEIATATTRVIHGVRTDGAAEVSPDGAWLAHAGAWPDSDAAISLYPVDGGDPRLLPRVDNGSIRTILGWTPDSGHVLFLVELPSAADGTTSTFELWRGSRDGARVERIAPIPDAAGGAALHPDGRTIAFLAGRTRGEIWALDRIGASRGQAEANGGER